MSIRDAIAAVVARRDLSEDEAAATMEEIMTDAATPSQIAALLTALRMKGETVDEIAGMVRVMRAKSVPLALDGDVLDVVGTGAVLSTRLTSRPLRRWSAPRPASRSPSTVTAALRR